MLVHFQELNLGLQAGPGLIAPGALWLEPEDSNGAAFWADQTWGVHAGDLDLPHGATWHGLVDASVSDADRVLPSIVDNGMRASLMVGDWFGVVTVRDTAIVRPPGTIGQMVVGVSRIGDARGSHVLEVIGQSEPPPALRAPTSWAQRIPRRAPSPVRSAEIRVKAIADIEAVGVELAANEFTGAERGIVEELVLPALQQIIAALRLDEELVARWAAQRPKWGESMDDATKARKILGYSPQAAAVVAGIDAFIHIMRFLLGVGD